MKETDQARVKPADLTTLEGMTMRDTIRDLRFALRALLRSPGLGALVILILAAGIGANTALFSAVYGVILNPLPFEDADRLISVWSTLHGHPLDRYGTSIPDYHDWAARVSAFESLAAMAPWRFSVTGREEPLSLTGYAVSANYFGTFGRLPVLGRDFTEGETVEGSNQVAILGHSTWTSSFGADPAVVGSTVSLDGEPFEVVGVAHPNMEFRQGHRPQVYIPLVKSWGARDERFMWVIGRLAPGSTQEQAAAELESINAALAKEHPSTNAGLGATLLPLKHLLYEETRTAVAVLSAAVAAVLLLACVNVASLLLARGETRHQEIAARLALGASRGRLVRQLLTESALLAILGGGIGLLLAWRLIGPVRQMVATFLASGPEHGPVTIELSLPVLGFSVLLSVVTVLLFGIAPALRATNLNLRDALAAGTRSVTRAAKGRRSLETLVVLELALAMVLTVIAGLLIRSTHALLQVDPGFVPERLVALEIQRPGGAEIDARRSGEIAAFAEEVLERLQALPGVTAAGMVAFHPLGGNNWENGLEIEGLPPAGENERRTAEWRPISAGYLESMGMEILKGRPFDRSDDGSRKVAIVDEEFVRRYLPPGTDPIGQRVRMMNRSLEVVGVTSSVKSRALAQAVDSPFVYEPISQICLPFMTFMVRTAIDPETVADAARRAIWAVDGSQPVSRVQFMEDLIERSSAPHRVFSVLLGLLGALATLIAAAGIYGVMSYTVARRFREIGIRRAFGAQTRHVFATIMRRGIVLTAMGVAIGLGAAYAAGRVVATLLFGVGLADLPSYAGAALILAAIAAAACALPARRAARIDPMAALRAE